MTVDETDTLYLGKPGDFTVDPQDGSFFVSDIFAGRTVQIDRSGSPVRTYGRKGRGPGEFSQPGLAFRHGGEVFIDDGGPRVFKVFHRSNGEFKRTHPREGILTSVRLEGDTAWLGLQNLERGTGVGRWDLKNDSIAYLVSLPEEYTASRPLAGIFNLVSLARWGDTLAVGFAGSNELYLYTSSGKPVDTVTVPARRRRSVPEDITSRLEEMSFPEMFSAFSPLFNLARLSDGRVALVHYDQNITGRAISADVYVTVLSADRRRACVDQKLPVTRDMQPRTAFRGDTLFVLEQKVADQTHATTSITGYLLSSDSCRWVEVEQGTRN